MKDSKILIVEDEQIIAENLRFILNEYGYHHVDVSIDAAETKSLFEQTTYDLVLMDINLGDTSTIDGIDLIKWLVKKYSFIFMYVTANADEKTVQKAKETQPAGYIIKPFINVSIYANVEIALNSLNSLKNKDSFTYTNKGMQYQVLLSEITHIKADGSYIHIYMVNEDQHFVRKSLFEFNQQYATIFIRIHKSILINKYHVQGYTSQSVKINEKKLPLGRTYKQYFIEQIKGISFS